MIKKQYIEECFAGLVFTTRCDKEWESIVPKVFIHNSGFKQTITNLIAIRLTMHKLPRKGNQSFGIILDGITIEEAGITTKDMDSLGILVITCSPKDLVGKRLFSEQMWNFSNFHVISIKKIKNT